MMATRATTCRTSALREAVEAYHSRSRKQGRDLTLCHIATGRCAKAATSFINTYRGPGKVTLVQVAEWRGGPLPRSADKRWLDFVARPLKAATAYESMIHWVVRVDSAYVDLTGAQFGARFGRKWCYTRAELGALWARIYE